MERVKGNELECQVESLQVYGVVAVLDGHEEGRLIGTIYRWGVILVYCYLFVWLATVGWVSSGSMVPTIRVIRAVLVIRGKRISFREKRSTSRNDGVLLH